MVIPDDPGPPNAAPDGESFKTSGSLTVPLKFCAVQSLLFPDWSSPIGVFPSNGSQKPVVPNVHSYFLGLQVPVSGSVNAKFDGASACPSMK